MLARDDSELGDDRLAVEGELPERVGVGAHHRGGARLAAPAHLLAQPRAEPLQELPRRRGRPRGPRHRAGEGSRVWDGRARVWEGGDEEEEEEEEACGEGKEGGGAGDLGFCNGEDSFLLRLCLEELIPVLREVWCRAEPSDGDPTYQVRQRLNLSDLFLVTRYRKLLGAPWCLQKRENVKFDGHEAIHPLSNTRICRKSV